MKKMETILGLVLWFVTSSAFAETADAKTSKEIYSDWQLNCAERGEIKQCSVSQELKTDKGHTAAVINLSYVEQKVVLEFGLPLMMDLTSAVSVSVDDGATKNYPYNACNSRACFVIRRDDKELLAAFKKGALAQIEAKAFNGQNIEMNVSLKGFSGAFNELMKR